MSDEKFEDTPFNGMPDAATQRRDEVDREFVVEYCEQAEQDGVIIIWGSQSFSAGMFYAVAMSVAQRNQMLAEKQARRKAEHELYSPRTPLTLIPTKLGFGDIQRLQTFQELAETRREAVFKARVAFTAIQSLNGLPD